jgi:tetratricopeptide (TPR) repeat protein
MSTVAHGCITRDRAKYPWESNSLNIAEVTIFSIKEIKMNEDLLKSLKDKAVAIQREGSTAAMIEFETELSAELEKSEPETRMEISKIKAEVYQKRKALERNSSANRIKELIATSRFDEALAEIRQAALKGSLTADTINLLRNILGQRPASQAIILELLQSIPIGQRTSDVHRLLTELTSTTEGLKPMPVEQSALLRQRDAIPAASVSPEITQPAQMENLKMATSDIDQMMAEADGLFYSGKLAEAAAKYEKVYDLDPTKTRAADRLKDIREGNLPEAAIPSEAGTLYGRALSLIRRGKYADALQMAEKAIASMKGINYKPLAELQNKAYAAQQAEGAYRDAKQAEQNGNWNEALRYYDQAIATYGDDPRYGTDREELQQLIQKFNQVKIVVDQPARNIAEGKRLLEAEEALRNVQTEHPDIVNLKNLKIKLDNIKYESSTNIGKEVTTILDDLEQHPPLSVSAALSRVREAISAAECAQKLGYPAALLERAKEDEEHFKSYDAKLNTHLSSSWNLVEVLQVRGKIRESIQKFPEDKRAQDLKKTLAVPTTMISIIGIIAIVFLCLLLVINRGPILSGMSALINSPTPTFTSTPLPSPTLTLIPTLAPTLTNTPTLVPTNTPVPTITPTPIIYVYAKQIIFLRQQCYTQFRAVPGQPDTGLPSGTRLKVLIGPEGNIVDESLGTRPLCAYVQYRESSSALFGYVLWGDVSP